MIFDMDGVEGMSLATEFKPEVLVLDLGLPGIAAEVHRSGPRGVVKQAMADYIAATHRVLTALEVR